ncbi:hypothetical protein FQV27_07135 [Paracoccus aurantiacus]|uniref:Uncharacterized protein n=1 Tax=Paracoccus aurantiacus TaxID=2599412 RepID=A0A5C6S4X3_9RHOB|nr:hypothetical protein [Paracoccus aurantiacus]TXB69878.1 hypothetical protein FQV27_07135 [Paracoccus aurantiacus]
MNVSLTPANETALRISARPLRREAADRLDLKENDGANAARLIGAYAMAVEQVEAGGATDPEAVTRSGARSAAKEGRQFHAVKQVDFWRRLDRAISGGRVTIGAKSISHRDLMRAIAIDGLSVAQLIAAMGFARSNVRQFKMLAGVVDAATAMAVELGMMEAPEPAKQEPKPKKTADPKKMR